MTGMETLMIAGLVAAAAGGGMAAMGQHQQGKEASRAASAQADQLREKGNQELALSQKRADEERRRGALTESAAIARSAAGGGDVTDKTTMDIIGDIASVSEYNALTHLYEGQSKKRDLYHSASITQHKGRAARRAGNMAAFSTLLKTAGSMAMAAGSAPGAEKTATTATPKAGTPKAGAGYG